MAGYSGTPLVNKIGIKPGHTLLLVNAPSDFASTLGDMPEGATVTTKATHFDVAIVFVSSAAELAAQFRQLRPVMEENGMVWTAWPKKTSGVPTDLNENRVRDLGLTAGLVDVKVCAIDDTWSGLKFVIRVADRKKTAPATKVTTKATVGANRPAKTKKAAAK